MITIPPHWQALLAALKKFVAVTLGEKPLDAYAIWGVLTQLRALGEGPHTTEVLNFLVELEHPYDPAIHLFPSSKGRLAMPVKVPSAYLLGSPWASPSPAPTFVTLRLAVNGRPWEDVLRDVQDLILLPYVKRLQIGQQRGKDNPDPGQRPDAPLDLPAWVGGAKVLIGVMDDASPFAHPALRRVGSPLSTRVVSLWNQTTLNDKDMTPRPPPKGFPYGRHWSHAQLDQLLDAHVHEGQVDEAAVYAYAGMGRRLLARRASHAAAVTCLLAGAGRATLRMPQPVDDGDTPLGFEKPKDDPAAAAPLLVVQLPPEQTAVRAGRWLSVNALDGLHHLVGVARELGRQHGKAPPPLVVNMSYGAMAGPHDGTGMLESAIDELCRASKGQLAVVLAAGNSHGTRRDAEQDLKHLPGGMHARRPLKPGGEASFTLFIPPDKQFETYVEFWFSVQGRKPGEDQFLALESPGQVGEVEIVIQPPTGDAWPAAVCPGLHMTPEAGLFFVRQSTQGHHRSMALLVVAATQVSGKYISAPSGRWRVTVRHKKAAGTPAARSFQVDAWVERDDTEVGAVRGQSARLVEHGDGTASGLTDENTFTSVATGRETFRVGAVMDRGAGLASERVSAYSAAGASDKQGPEFSAIADAHAALPGIRVSGALSGMVLRANGTSMAAPQAARYLAEGLAQGKPLKDLRPKPGRGNARLGRKTV